MSCCCNRTFTTAENPVDFNYRPLFPSVPVVAVEVVKDDNYTPAVEPHVPPLPYPALHSSLYKHAICTPGPFFFSFSLIVLSE